MNGRDWLSELMMVSQIIAWEGGAVGEGVDEGYVARTQTKSCLVFQLKREVKSVGHLEIKSIRSGCCGVG